MSERCFIGLGSNQADPVAQLHNALEAINQLTGVSLLARSSLYSSVPLGPQDQPSYVNAVAMIDTRLPPEALLDQLQAIEQQHGRVRKAERWGPLFLPAYGIASLLAWWRGGHYYYDNAFEREAYGR